jgi:hypothetical protein
LKAYNAQQERIKKQHQVPPTPTPMEKYEADLKKYNEQQQKMKEDKY